MKVLLPSLFFGMVLAALEATYKNDVVVHQDARLPSAVIAATAAPATPTAGQPHVRGPINGILYYDGQPYAIKDLQGYTEDYVLDWHKVIDPSARPTETELIGRKLHYHHIPGTHPPQYHVEEVLVHRIPTLTTWIVAATARAATATAVPPPHGAAPAAGPVRRCIRGHCLVPDSPPAPTLAPTITRRALPTAVPAVPVPAAAAAPKKPGSKGEVRVCVRAHCVPVSKLPEEVRHN